MFASAFEHRSEDRLLWIEGRPVLWELLCSCLRNVSLLSRFLWASKCLGWGGPARHSIARPVSPTKTLQLPGPVPQPCCPSCSITALAIKKKKAFPVISASRGAHLMLLHGASSKFVCWGGLGGSELGARSSAFVAVDGEERPMAAVCF